MGMYEDLSSLEKAYITNGCGGKGGWVRPPYRVFYKTSCNKHDFFYWVGGSEADRAKADKGLFSAMCEDVKRISVYKRPHYYLWCHLYYIAVVNMGSAYFNYTAIPRRVEDYDWSLIINNYSPLDLIPWGEMRLN